MQSDEPIPCLTCIVYAICISRYECTENTALSRIVTVNRLTHSCKIMHNYIYSQFDDSLYDHERAIAVWTLFKGGR